MLMWVYFGALWTFWTLNVLWLCGRRGWSRPMINCCANVEWRKAFTGEGRLQTKTNENARSAVELPFTFDWTGQSGSYHSTGRVDYPWPSRSGHRLLIHSSYSILALLPSSLKLLKTTADLPSLCFDCPFTLLLHARAIVVVRPGLVFVSRIVGPTRPLSMI